MLSGSWKTGLVGWGLIGFDIAAFIVDCIVQSGLPSTKEEWFAFIAVFFAGLNGVLSKDHDKTNSKDPAKAVTVSPVAAAGPNPAEKVQGGQTVASVLVVCTLVGMGMMLTACDTLGPMFGQYKNQLESIVGVAVAGQYTILITKDGKTLVTENWDCTTDGKKLTGCHKVGSRTLSSDVITPVK